MKFQPQKAILDALAALKKASVEDILLHIQPESKEYESSIRTGIYPARDSGLIFAKKEIGNRVNLWSLTEKGKAKQEGREFTLGTKVETINSLGTNAPKAAAKPVQPAAEDYGATFNSDGKLIIWRGHDEVVFNPPEAAQLIAFIANQMPWVEYVNQHCKK